MKITENTGQALLLQQLMRSHTQSGNMDNAFGNILFQQMAQQNLSTVEPANFGTSSMESNITGLLLSALIHANGSIGPSMMSLSNALINTDSDNLLFGAKSYGSLQYMTGTIDAMSNDRIPYAASKAVNPSITSDMTNRNPVLYKQVINQFQVETNPRYAVNKKGTGDTYCNIFMWDVTRAMGVEIPHYVDPKTKAPRYYPDVKGASEMNANAIYNWLHEHGGKYGWVEVDAEQAQAMANQGKPVVTALRNNSGGHGHVQVVCPSADGVYDPERGVTIAQAGRNLTSYRPITKIYNKSLPKVKYFAHM